MPRYPTTLSPLKKMSLLSYQRAAWMWHVGFEESTITDYFNMANPSLHLSQTAFNALRYRCKADFPKRDTRRWDSQKQSELATQLRTGKSAKDIASSLTPKNGKDYSRNAVLGFARRKAGGLDRLRANGLLTPAETVNCAAPDPDLPKRLLSPPRKASDERGSNGQDPQR